jgi:hypothetical protein
VLPPGEVGGARGSDGGAAGRLVQAGSEDPALHQPVGCDVQAAPRRGLKRRRTSTPVGSGLQARPRRGLKTPPYINIDRVGPSGPAEAGSEDAALHQHR